MYKIIVFLLLFTKSIFGQNIGKVIISGDYWCPYNCNTFDKNQGYLVDLLRQAFKAHNLEVEYILMPWFDALKKCRSGEIHAVIGANISEAKGFIITQQPQVIDQIGLFAKNNLTIKFNGNFSILDDKRIGITLGYNYPEDFLNYINLRYQDKNILFENRDNSLKIHIQNLLSNRIDVIVESINVMSWHIKNEKLKIKTFGVISDNEGLYIAFSPILKRSKAYAKILEDYTTDKENQKDIETLKEKYGI